MKAILKLSFVGIIIISMFSCEKNQFDSDLVTQELTIQKDVKLGNNMYFIDMNNLSEPVTAFPLHYIAAFKKPKMKNISASGILTTQMGTKMNFHAMLNKAGMHGNSKANGPGYLRNIRFDSDCIFKVGNQAHFGGQLTIWDIDTAFAPPGFPPVDVGWSIYFAVADSGEGNNAPPDAIGAAFFVAPPTDTAGVPIPPLCMEVYDAYQGFGVPFLPGIKPTNIQVK